MCDEDLVDAALHAALEVFIDRHLDGESVDIERFCAEHPEVPSGDLEGHCREYLRLHRVLRLPQPVSSPQTRFRWAAAVILVALIAGVAFSSWRVFRSEDRESSGAITASNPRESTDSPNSPDLQQVPSPPEGAVVSEVEGIVISKTGDRVAGARVEIELTIDSEPRTEVAYADPQGAYRLEVVGSGIVESVTVLPGVATPVQRPFGPTRPVRIPPITLSAETVLHGVVVDQNEQPVPLSLVWVWLKPDLVVDRDPTLDPDRIVAADASGAFTVTGLGTVFTVEAVREEWVCSQRLVGQLTLTDEIHNVTLKLEPESSISGTVLDENRDPRAGVAVVASPSALRSQATEVEGVFSLLPRRVHAVTNDQGLFELAVTSSDYIVSIDLDDYRPWSAKVTPGSRSLDVQLDPGVTLTGVVRDPRGAPIERAKVWLGAPDPAKRRFTDENGLFSFGGCERGQEFTLYVQAVGHAISVSQPVKTDEENPLSIDLEREQVIRGIVVDEDGQALPGASVTIEGDRVIDHGGIIVDPRPTWERSFRGVWSTTSDEAGLFEFRSLYDGEFRVRVTHPQEADRVGSVMARGGDDVRVQLATTSMAALEGRVFDASSGEPVTHFNVRIAYGDRFEANTRMRGESFQGSDGLFRIIDLEPGTTRVFVLAPGRAVWLERLTISRPQDYSVTAGLSEGRTLQFRVLDLQREPAPRADVRFENELGERLLMETAPSVYDWTLLVNEDGRATAIGLPPGPITAYVSFANRRDVWKSVVDLTKPLRPDEIPWQFVIDVKSDD